MNHDMSRSAIENGPDDDPFDWGCDACQGTGEMRNDFGEEWTCTACDGTGLS